MVEEEKFFNTKAFWLAVLIGMATGLLTFMLVAPTIFVWYINLIAN